MQVFIHSINLISIFPGVWPTSYASSRQGYEICYATNVLGPYLLFLKLQQTQLASDCRIIYVTGDIYITVSDSSPDYLYSSTIGCQIAYSRSKLGLMWMVSQYLRENPDGYNVYIVHPGIIASGGLIS
jgi:NAD(P)-dependent dehydrogenase (short-subunit alcohol dehydrogenase family)